MGSYARGRKEIRSVLKGEERGLREYCKGKKGDERWGGGGGCNRNIIKGFNLVMEGEEGELEL